MNRKRKFNELYKGVFKNDKKSCLIDLKPLDKKREIEKELNNREKEDAKFDISKQHKILPNRNKNRLGINLRVAKNLGFGSFFRKLREEIIDIFLSKDEFISFEGLINSNSVNDLFNFRDSTQKNFIDKEIITLENISKQGNPKSYINIQNKTTELIKRQEEIGMTIINDDEEILYEDECETIYKKKKMPQAQGVSNKKIHFYYDDNTNIKENLCDENQAENIPQKYFNLSQLNNLSELKKTNSNLKMAFNNFPVERISQNLQTCNLSKFSSNNIMNSNTYNQFIPNINSKQSRLMTNKNFLEMEQDENFALYKLKQPTRRNKISNHHQLLLSEEPESSGGEIIGAMKNLIKGANQRGALQNLTNNFEY